ncbi:5-formyltetrahydrofolate cyclo-ligase [Evansella sp. AB-rgal1]|uniref:5-formyltetrahydrofolate cyclo-ligase n=1 Tax=Evansella sp. AB-rgal1 TaxID=3242696 RepID=UPI00359F00FB
MNKKHLREKVKKKLECISLAEKKERDNVIQQRLFSLPAWQAAKVVGVTISMEHEIDTYTIINHAWEEGKTVVVPKCIPKERKLLFYRITSFHQLEESYYGLKEPIPNKTEKYHPEDMDLLLVPGIVFDRRGYRIGHGGGYYDRFLHGKSMKTCSLCYDFQFVEVVPNENHDIPVQIIIKDTDLMIL